MYVCHRALWTNVSDVIWRQRYHGSPLAQIMACSLTAPGHYLNQCWLLISKILYIHARAIRQQVAILSFYIKSMKTILLKLLAHLPGDNELTHWGRDKMDAISQTTFSNTFSWMKIFEFRLTFHWSLFPRFQLANVPALVQLMAWRRPGDMPLSEPVIISSPTHICITRPQWVNKCFHLIRHCCLKGAWDR